MAGGGLVALPTAMIQLGIIFGITFSLIMNLITMITSFMLGACWNILIRRWPEYRSHCRKPYPEMAYRAMGPLCKTLVSLCIDLTQFGIAVVYLLLSAKNIHDAIKSFSDADISFCYVILIVAVCLMPILFLKSPQDFW
uniref:Amino acid transporter transmembrane domain-containing protein n=1 Tax=Panagrolaimus sp. PS1159 TaxID=55785 RepID=A0AC35EYX8_9BILA